MKAAGAFLALLWLTSPVLMGLFKLFGWEPFGSMEWVVITFSWWWMIMVVITAVIWKAAVSVEVTSSTESPTESLIDKDLH